MQETRDAPSSRTLEEEERRHIGFSWTATLNEQAEVFERTSGQMPLDEGGLSGSSVTDEDELESGDRRLEDGDRTGEEGEEAGWAQTGRVGGRGQKSNGSHRQLPREQPGSQGAQERALGTYLSHF